ncbi:MAG: virulence factor TspB C-terminal domain-related protein [Acinetobacter sp.]|uniref:virulence factor TspB C-terminal domain-related protein n=1 Tax=Acinetobacter sp. TaxID=472 RepID=UPI002621D67F|nr:virulence factor TspB C-terminal domain-related protein [Acinetobacter sp.]MDD2946455.1 virulence factor TspB C-terminal domain-related protein [Acinetobacter sp.]MDD2946466.1 virulence factor TspB C-terminal domain-related protein [Acinetobacter sp.]
MNKFFITILFLFSSLISSFSFAADDGDWWLQRNITVGDGKNTYGKKVYGSAARSVMESVPIKDSTREEVRQLIKRSIAVYKPTPSKVGGSMLKRIYSPQAIVGTAAVTGLLAAIGWVMEDGVYVKKIPLDDDIDPNYYWQVSGVPESKKEGAKASCLAYAELSTQHGVYAVETYSVSKTGTTTANCSFRLKPILACSSCYENRTVVVARGSEVPDYKSKEKTVPLTAALLGAAMLGSQYTDPDPNFDNDTVNTGDYTGVKETYEHDPSGVGDELADAMDDKLKNAKPIDDGKSSYIGDPKYDDRPLGDDRDDSSDRGWDEKGDEATGGTEPTKDPETGEATGNQSITLQFPLFCSWASKMCQWYDDWKKSDQVYKDHMTKTEDHQGQEKSFWQSVKDWFDWTKKEDDLPEKDESDLDLEGELVIDQKTKNISWSAQCPTAQTIPINFHGVTAEITVADFSYLCSLDWLIKPFVIAFASISAAFIVFGFNRGGDDG